MAKPFAHPMLILAVALLSACASVPEPTTTPAWPQSAPALPPAEVSDALLTELPPLAAPVQEPRLNIDVGEIPARTFFMSLVADTPVNMVVHPAVEGTISLTLKNVTLGEVMELVREVYGYEYERRPSGYIVLPARLQSRVFDVDVLNLRRSGESRTRINAGELTNGGSQNSTANGGNSGNTASSQGSEDLYSSRVETRTESDLWAELERALRTLVGDGVGRSIVISPQSSMVVVRALPSELREVADYLDQAVRTVNRQVVLEAKILEVTLNDGFQSGVNWAALVDDGAGTLAQTGGGTLFGPGGRSNIVGALTDLNPDAPSTEGNTASSAFGGVISLLYQRSDFAAMVELLQQQGEVRVLSSPRVATTNNQKAVIKVGSDEFFVTEVSTTTTAVGNSATSSPSVTLTPFFSGISLDVTPQIDAHGDVLLHVQPTVSEVVDQNKEIVLGGQDNVFNLPLALSTVRQSDTIVRARNRQVVVIGGLMRESSNQRDAQVPWVGDVPLLGNLFKQKKDVSSTTELVILIKPTVVDADPVWDEVRGSYGARLQDWQDETR